MSFAFQNNTGLNAVTSLPPESPTISYVSAQAQNVGLPGLPESYLGAKEAVKAAFRSLWYLASLSGSWLEALSDVWWPPNNVAPCVEVGGRHLDGVGFEEQV